MTAAGHAAYVTSETSAYGVEYHTARCTDRDCGWKSAETSSSFMAGRWATEHEEATVQQATITETVETTVIAPAVTATRFGYYQESGTATVVDYLTGEEIHGFGDTLNGCVAAGALARQLEKAADDAHRRRVMTAWSQVNFDAWRAPLVA
jgi:hypothetical protein